ncbi:MAG: Glu/Leu/Phe/Val dehydrogenase dimerization domain-containing protein [Gemmatimonadota bacterium]|nr:Glu/Leu/Phe/Val dehydrogenase dimerization domain-containing protein [Gemmatimonadota bacterium]
MSDAFAATLKDWDGESVVVGRDGPTETWIFIALHDTRLGPATGGTRLATYATPNDGLVDALRLSEGMTYKWAGLGMPYGGGKAVLAAPGPLDEDARTGLLDRYAARLASLRGAFRTGVDLGTTPEDMARIGALSGQAMGIVDGHPEDPGPYTALGVFVGMRAAVSRRFGSESLEGRSVLVQGVGDVGLPLAEMLVEAGALVRLCDIDADRAEAAATRLGAGVVDPERMWDEDVDVYAPCAIGATVNPDTVPRMRCRIVAGSANNQLLTPADAEALHARGILYAPDYIINAGGAMAFGRMSDGVRERAVLEAEVVGIEESLRQIFEEAEEAGESPLWAAQRRAERFLASAS